MKTETARMSVNFEIDFSLNEDEAKALDALAGYGTDEFLNAFYTKMGRAYLGPHEKGLRSMFEKIKQLRPQIKAVDDIKKSVEEIRSSFKN